MMMDFKKMRIIFVGLHNKPDMAPLDSHTKTGKLVDKIIARLPKNVKIVKTNIFGVEYLPAHEEMQGLKNEWYWENSPNENDVIVLLGQMVHETFDFDEGKILKIAHPASKRSHKEMNEYVEKSAEKINKLINL